jgi:small GTP-binding protein
LCAVRLVGRSEHRVVLVGDSGVGKTSLLNYLVGNPCAPGHVPTIGATYEHHCERISGADVRMQIWDTAGQERYKSLGPIYYRGSAAAVIVFALSDMATFAHLGDWLTAFRQAVPEGAIVVILGNKCDEPDMIEVTEKDVDQWRNEGFLYFRTSAVTGEGVKDAFRAVANEIQAAVEKKAKDEPPPLEMVEPVARTWFGPRIPCC